MSSVFPCANFSDPPSLSQPASQFHRQAGRELSSVSQGEVGIGGTEAKAGVHVYTARGVFINIWLNKGKALLLANIF